MNRTILIADDNYVDREIIKKQMGDYFNILEARDGREALSMLDSNYSHISAIILDIGMPELNGFEALQIIRSNPTYLDIPVIIVTVDGTLDVKRKAIEFGANGLLTKPYDSFLLRKSMENAISIRENSLLLNTLSKDKVTGLMSYELFFDECDRLIAEHNEGYYVMACVDIHNFKVINDQYGMDTGDKILRHIAACIDESNQQAKGISCRIHADRFAVLYPVEFSNTSIILDLHKKATMPPCINHSIRIKVGRYYIRDRSIRAKIVFERAIVAMESIKGRFDESIAVYSDSMRKDILHEQRIVNEMDEALSLGQFVPFYQPQYNHATGALIGAEALVRWKKGDKYVSPGEFIPIFEKNGFIYDVDKSVWKQVCEQLRKWLDEGKNPLPISVNISRCDLYKSDFFETICGLLKQYNLPTDLLRLEVTESAFSESTLHIVKMVNRLIDFGFIVEIDDFGSGYSSLNTLKDVPASILKLDMKFFEDTQHSERSGSIIESIVRMAKWLGMAVIAEGVEKTEQADYLKSVGCYYIQGYLYARPMPLNDYESLMEEDAHEQRMTRIRMVTTLDANQFWNPESMETLIFNSFVGGACIIEQSNDKLELLRVNNQYLQELDNVIPDGANLSQLNPVNFLDERNQQILNQAMSEAKNTKKQCDCELVYTSKDNTEDYIRYAIRLIASTQEREMFYCVIRNVTKQRETEKREIMAADKLQKVLNRAGGGITAVISVC